MTFTSRTLLVVGSVLLVHACYSAQELSHLSPASQAPKLPSNPPSDPATSIPGPPLTSSSSTSQLTSLPLDIVLETLISVAVLCVAIVLSAEELKPVSWRVWAGKVERERHKRKPVEELLSGKVQAEEGYEWLEDGHRKGFLDIRGLRREFAEWAKAGGDSGQK